MIDPDIRAACEAARDGDPEGLAQLRRRCLREARTIVDARAQLLATADDAVIDATERLVAGLRPLAECDDADLLRSELPLPADPLERGAVDDLRRRLAAIDARLSAGQIELGLEQVAAVLRDAEATAYAPVLAEATFREAALLRQHQRFDDAEAAGLRAYGLAEEADHRRLRAEIAKKYQQRYGLIFDPDSEVTVTCGVDAHAERKITMRKRMDFFMNSTLNL